MNIDEKLTPCQELGYKVGDKFRVEQDDPFTRGSIVSLYKDTRDNIPLFKLVDGYCEYKHCSGEPGGYVALKNVNKIESVNKYTRILYGVEVDVYDVLKAWEVVCPATQHAIKKLLMPGQRGSKDKLQDLKEAEQSIKRAIELNN